MKAFLGMGLLGSNFVKAMLRRGDHVQVWNRTATKAKALEAFGAKAFNSVADTVKGADMVHLTLKDDATVDEVLAAAGPGFKPGALIIDHTTTSAKGAIERTTDWKAKGITYLHAPVFMGPVNALESTGYMLVSGDRPAIERASPELAKMTGKLMDLGPEEGRAAGMKLTGNLFLLAFTMGLSDALALAKAQGISSADVAQLFSVWNPAAAVPARLKRMTDANFSEPSWELQMARKDAGLMISGAQDGGMHLVMVPAIAAEMDKWIARGHGHDDWMVMSRENI